MKNIKIKDENREHWFDSRMQFYFWFGSMVFMVAFQFFTYKAAVDKNSFRLDIIEKARAEVWENQKDVNYEFMNQLKVIGECLAVVKDKLDIK